MWGLSLRGAASERRINAPIQYPTSSERSFGLPLESLVPYSYDHEETFSSTPESDYLEPRIDLERTANDEANASGSKAEIERTIPGHTIPPAPQVIHPLDVFDNDSSDDEDGGVDIVTFSFANSGLDSNEDAAKEAVCTSSPQPISGASNSGYSSAHALHHMVQPCFEGPPGDARDRRIYSLEQDLDIALMAKREAEAKNVELRNELTESHEEIANLTALVKQLNTKCNVRTRHAQGLTKRLEKAETKHEQLMAEQKEKLAEQEAKLAEQNKRVAKITAACRENREEEKKRHEDEKFARERLEAEYQDYYNQAEIEKTTYKNDMFSMMSNLHDMRTLYGGSLELHVVNTLIQENAALRTTLQEKVEKLAKSEDDNRHLLAKLQAQDDETRRYTNLFRDAQAKADELNTQIGVYEAKVGKATKECEESQQQADLYYTVFETLHVQNEELRSNGLLLQLQSAVLRSKKMELDKDFEITTLQTQLDKATKDLERYRERNGMLEDESTAWHFAEELAQAKLPKALERIERLQSLAKTQEEQIQQFHTDSPAPRSHQDCGVLWASQEELKKLQLEKLNDDQRVENAEKEARDFITHHQKDMDYLQSANRFLNELLYEMAIPAKERLEKELAELYAEKGLVYLQQSDPWQLCHDHGFGDPTLNFLEGSVGRTFEVCRRLAPLGWFPLFKRGMVYMKPLQASFRERDRDIIQEVMASSPLQDKKEREMFFKHERLMEETPRILPRLEDAAEHFRILDRPISQSSEGTAATGSSPESMPSGLELRQAHSPVDVEEARINANVEAFMSRNNVARRVDDMPGMGLGIPVSRFAEDAMDVLTPEEMNSLPAFARPSVSTQSPDYPRFDAVSDVW